MQEVKITAICWASGAILLLLGLCGCSSERTFYTYAAKHPDKVAELCANEFYSKDSIPEPVVKYIPANNVNLTNALDSAKQLADSLKSKSEADSINVTERERQQKQVIGTLANTISKLKASYKPCKPDSFYVYYNIYRDKPNTLASLKHAENQAADYKVKQALAEQSKDGWRTAFWIAFAVAVLAIGSKFIKIPFLK